MNRYETKYKTIKDNYRFTFNFFYVKSKNISFQYNGIYAYLLLPLFISAIKEYQTF
jgi:hypothetical protein